MDDLISRSALLKKSFVLEGHRVVSYLDVIEAPTAYDVDAVVAEIQKKHCQKCRNILSVPGAEEYCKSVNCDIGIICDIVKRGGVE